MDGESYFNKSLSSLRTAQVDDRYLHKEVQIQNFLLIHGSCTFLLQKNSCVPSVCFVLLFVSKSVLHSEGRNMKNVVKKKINLSSIDRELPTDSSKNERRIKASLIHTAVNVPRKFPDLHCI